MIKAINIIKLSIVYASLFLHSSFAQENKDMNKEKVNREVKKIMEMMVLPRLGIYQMAENNQYSSKDFIHASKIIIKYSAKMKGIAHPDKAFQKSNEEMLKALTVFEGAVKSNKKDLIKMKWHILNIKCNNCHNMYKIK